MAKNSCLSLFHLQAKAERRKRIEEMSAETRAFYENIRFYKFYPQPSPGTPDISALKVGQTLLTLSPTIFIGLPYYA